jgi:glycosyltransferase involved in cell wall biosynthesis
MRVAIVDSQVAFIQGGAEMLRTRLAEAMRAQGHQVENVLIPLSPSQPAAVAAAMDFVATIDPTRWDAPPDIVVALRFPGYLIEHPAKRVWLLHQMRQFYEYFEHTRARSGDPSAEAVRDRIVQADTRSLSAARDIRVQSRRIGERLFEHNGVRVDRTLLPPLPRADVFYRGRFDRYVFSASRLENHKRQAILIEAMAHVKADVKAVIAGEGGAYHDYQRLIAARGVGDRVMLVGLLSDEVQAAWYANSLAVFFGPHDEDYGFITLEAMLSGKPVITCRDSGGPLHFVEDGVNGFVVDPDPLQVAARIDELAARPARAREMGEAGYDRYRKLDLSWERTAAALLA